MNLQTYIATFISFLNGVVVPFMLGMAFLVFVINVFRFFILGGANPESQEKAKQLAIYGVGAFVFIIIFWGVVGLLTSSFGLLQLGERESRCSDYECPDGNDPNATNVGMSDSPNVPNNNIGDPRPPGSGFGAALGPGVDVSPSFEPSTPTAINPDSLPSTNPMSTPQGQDAPPTMGGVADYSNVTREAMNTIDDIFPTLESSMLTDQFSTITESGQPDSVRVNTARAFLNAGLISTADFDSVLANVNAVRAQDNFPPISSSFAVADPVYTQALIDYYNNTETATSIISNWYGGSGQAAQNEIDSLFNTTDYTLEQRQAEVDRVVGTITSPNEDLVIELRTAIETAHQVEQRLN